MQWKFCQQVVSFDSYDFVISFIECITLYIIWLNNSTINSQYLIWTYICQTLEEFPYITEMVDNQRYDMRIHKCNCYSIIDVQCVHWLCSIISKHFWIRCFLLQIFNWFNFFVILIRSLDHQIFHYLRDICESIGFRQIVYAQKFSRIYSWIVESNNIQGITLEKLMTKSLLSNEKPCIGNFYCRKRPNEYTDLKIWNTLFSTKLFIRHSVLL